MHQVGQMIRAEGFNHPDDKDLARYELAPARMIGNFKPDFETQIIGGDQVIVEQRTGLMWERSGSSEPVTSEEAQAYIDCLNQARFARCSNWRLATVEELASLLKPAKERFDEHGNGYYVDQLFDARQEDSWSIDISSQTGLRWHVSFDHGFLGSYTNLESQSWVRAVRSID